MTPPAVSALGTRGLASLLFIAAVAIGTLAARAADPPANALLNISYATLSTGKALIKLTFREPLVNPPPGFALNNPPRIALDFANMVNEFGKNTIDMGEGDLRSLSLVHSGNRTRVVVTLLRPVSYQTRIEGNSLLVMLKANEPSATGGKGSQQFAQSKRGDAVHSLRNVDFRRGTNGEGRVIIDLSDNTTGIDVRREGKGVVLDFASTTLPANLDRRLDVADFGTPVKAIDTTSQGSGVRMIIEPQGMWEHSAYQSDGQFIVEVKRVLENPNKLVQGAKASFNGERLSLNFQNVEVRSVLQVLADFTGRNVVVSDSVAGNITLRLKDVPWDQALDIILQSKSLSMRSAGNVIMIAPTDELTTKEKLALEAIAQKTELEQLQTESMQLNYQKADEVQKLLGDEKQRMLSKRGSAVVDTRTNTLFIQDTASRLEDVRRLIGKIDQPMHQVMIEARIVIADDKFSKQLGVRFGNQSGHNVGRTNIGISSNIGDSSSIANAVRPGIPTSPDNLNVNLPIAGATGAIALTLLNIGTGNLINFELSALEADKRGKVVSNPRVITSDKQKATIEQGTEIPYLQASSSGATSVAFKPAVLSLAVTPRITPDGKVIMDLEVKKDSVGQIFAGIPSIDTKKVLTQIQVDDGDTAVLGGIYEQTSRNDVDKVPVLGDIPYVGGLFRKNARQDDKTELLIFITPKILKDSLSIR